MLRYVTKELAQKIVCRTMEIIDCNINVMNEKGVIIGSGDKKRMNQIHEGALMVLKSGSSYEITQQQADSLRGVKPGVNLPIFFNGGIVGVVGLTGLPEQIRNYGELVRMAAEMIFQEMILIEEIQWDERLKEELVHQLLQQEDPFDSLFFDRANRFDINLYLPRVALIVTADNRHEVMKLVKKYIANNDLYAMLPDGVVILKSTETGSASSYAEQLKKQLWASGMVCKLAGGSVQPDFKGLRVSYQQAKDTLAVGSKLQPEAVFYCYSDYQIPVLLRQSAGFQENHDLLHHYEKLKEYDKKKELIETLTIYIEENGEGSTAAKKLFIHRNTLSYRLDKIQSITGKDPRKVKDLLELYVALLLSKIS
ncbi:sugar diacid recognition domain-containing protein [Priestia megaterium]|uniref:sugar diacid recognition domain-containing protein n=1 Tax=Priestia megaterium TaxID=1404 RepID=UPI0024533516|nr:sugar diacid recognition domain-containing protein [Priestia megaterium]MDH3142088.1 sugar diacid recognition domain-containing protein [Priestia megaterium]MED4236801.1 sugar diacid recognition domain-containing protein [Priestia megaterium]